MNKVIDKTLAIPAEVYSRISGYFRPVYVNGKSGQWNKGKTEEFSERKICDPARLIMDEIKNTLKIEKSKGNEDAGFLIERL